MIVISYIRASGASVTSSGVPRSYLAGCGIANGTDAVNDINVAAGVCRDSTNTVDITVAAMAGKQLDVGWAPGASAGMRNSAIAIANTTYHIYAVSKADGTQDIYAHTSTTVATVITALQAEGGGSAYLYARRIASIVRAGATILAFTQDGNYFLWSVAVLDGNAVTNPGTAAVSRTLTVPVGLNVFAFFNVVLTADATNYEWIATDLAFTDAAPSQTAAPLSNISILANGRVAAGGISTRTNTAAQIRTRQDASSAGSVMYLATLGFIDTRGRDA